MKPRAFARETDDDGRARYSLMAEDEAGEIELDTYPNDGEADAEAERLNRPENAAELRFMVRCARTETGDWARRTT